jgi:hypothetical protein
METRESFHQQHVREKPFHPDHIDLIKSSIDLYRLWLLGHKEGKVPVCLKSSSQIA